MPFLSLVILILCILLSQAATLHVYCPTALCSTWVAFFTYSNRLCVCSSSALPSLNHPYILHVQTALTFISVTKYIDYIINKSVSFVFSYLSFTDKPHLRLMIVISVLFSCTLYVVLFIAKLTDIIRNNTITALFTILQTC